MAEYPPTIRARDFTDPRTASDRRAPRTRHVQRSESKAKKTNTVNQPKYGVLKLWIKVGGKESASHIARKQKKVVPPDDAGRVNFVPRDPARVERPRQGPGETVEIHWKLRHPELIERAKIELFTRGSNASLWTLDLVWDDGELVPDPGVPTQPSNDYAKEGFYRWDGCLDVAPPGMSEACVTVTGSPYKLKMTVAGTDAAAKSDAKRRPAEAWTYFDVLMKKIELEWGNTPTAKDVIPENRADVGVNWHAKVLLLEKAILDDLHAHAITANQKIFLRSDLFTTSFDAENDTDAPYRAYREKWGQGPLIPLFARLFLEDSGGNAVNDTPWALDGAKVLWDWEDPGGDKSAAWLNAEKPATKDFVKRALDYYVKLHAEQGHAPRGSNNCHVDHGGKRGPNAPSVFPQQVPANYDNATAAVIPKEFPFKVDPCPAPRPWASLSEPRTRGVLAGYTGALFQPSRMAGDCYRVSAYLAYDGFPLGDDAATLQHDQPADLRKSTGTFEVWRKLQVRVLQKTNAAPNIAGNTVRDIYRAAGVEVEVVSNTVLNALAWETAFNNQLGTLRANNAVNGVDPWFFNRKDTVYAIGPDCVFGDQKPTPDGVAFRDRNTLNPPVPAAWDQFYGGVAPGAITSTCAGAMLGLVQREYVDTAFPANMNPALDIEGVFVLLYRYRSSHWHDQLEGAANSPTSTRTRAIVNVAYHAATPSRQGANYGPGLAVKGFDEVLAHEIGHALWLPHATSMTDAKDRVHLPYTPPDDAPNHDTNDSCLMNYHPAADRFCGVCNLRLRGWSVRGPTEGANAPEVLVELFNAPNKNRRAFKLTRCTVSLPATPPKTRRLMYGSDTEYNVPDRTQLDVTRDETDLAQNPAVVLLYNTVVETPGLGEPTCNAAAQPILLTCVVAEAPAGSQVVWRVERHGDDDPKIEEAGARPLPSLTTHHGHGTATLLADAVGTFSVKCSVNVDGKLAFDDTAACITVNFVIVKVTRDRSDHKFTASHVEVHPTVVGGDVILRTGAGGANPMRVKTKVKLLGGGADGRRGLDKVQGGWINNMLVEDTQVEYVDHNDTVQWRAKTFILHKRADNSLEALAPAMDRAHPLVDKHTAGAIAGWVPRRGVLSAATPSPNIMLNAAAGTDLRLGRELWIAAEDGPEQGWDEHPPTQGVYTLSRFNLDLEFCAYLCFWTDDAKTLVGVLEEVPWEVHAAARRGQNGVYKLDGKPRVLELPKTKHEELVPALTTGVETCPPGTVQISSHPRNIVGGQPIGTHWTTGLP